MKKQLNRSETRCTMQIFRGDVDMPTSAHVPDSHLATSGMGGRGAYYGFIKPGVGEGINLTQIQERCRTSMRDRQVWRRKFFFTSGYPKIK